MLSFARVLFAALLTVAFVPAAWAAANVPPAPDANTVHVLTTVEVAAASAAQALTALRRYRDAVRAGGGTVELLQDTQATNRFAITELWRDRMTYDAFKAGAASTQLAQALAPIQSAAPQTDLYRGLVTAAQKPPGAGRNVHAISRFAIIPARAADYGEMASALGVASRDEAGAVRYDIIQGLIPNQDKFAILERWSTAAQHQAHKGAMHVRTFHEDVARLLDSMIEERVYNVVN
jgi:quinol monooxygenase YgiN